MKARFLHCALGFAMALIGLEKPVFAEEKPPSKSGVSYVAMGSPVVKLQMTAKGVYLEPTFVAGPGAGYIWNDGKWGVIFYPGIGALDGRDFSIAPHVTFHAFIVSAGLGYEFRFARTNDNQSTRWQAGYPILTLGLSVPFALFSEKK